MKFYADAMLGDLSRFLRILGYDCLLRSNKQDKEDYFTVSTVEKRIILTRSKNLHKQALKRNIQSILINKKGIVQSLCIIGKKVELCLDLEPNNSRCSVCNGVLIKVDKDSIQNQIKEGTFENFTDFWKCTKCKKIYWEGEHWKDIRKKIERVKECVANEN